MKRFVSATWQLRVIARPRFLAWLCTSVLLILVFGSAPLRAAKIDRSVDHDQCLGSGGIPQFTRPDTRFSPGWR